MVWGREPEAMHWPAHVNQGALHCDNLHIIKENGERDLLDLG